MNRKPDSLAVGICFIIKLSPGFTVGLTLALLWGLAPCFAQQPAGLPPGTEKDSAQVAPAKLESKAAWEKVLSAPGLVLTYPFKILLEGAAKGGAFAQDKKALQKIMEIYQRASYGFLPLYESRIGVGIKYQRKDVPVAGSLLELLATRGLRGRSSYGLSLQKDRFPHNALDFSFTGGYRYFGDDDFFGIGPDTRKADKTNYALRRVNLESRLTAKTDGPLSAVFSAGVEWDKTQRGRDDDHYSTHDIYSNTELPGIAEKAVLGALALELRRDTRPGNYLSGGLQIIRAGFYLQLDGNRFAFWKTTVDLRKHVHLFYNRMLVLRLAAENTERLGERLVPFYHLSELGRGSTVRGFDRGRFRDDSMLMASAEYRYPIWRNFDFGIFGDAGQVSPDIFRQLALNDFRLGYGMSFRIRGAKGLITMLELGKSSDGWRFYLGFNDDRIL
jgi:surface antigen Omp85-like protein